MTVLVKKVPINVCNVCGHEWQSANGEKPLRCSKCKSPYWDVKREKK